MDEVRPSRIAWATSLLVSLVGVAGAGAGPVNGDAAIYAWQAAEGVFDERPVHLAYVLLAWVLKDLGPSPLWSLDVLSAVAAGALVAMAGTWARREGGDEGVGALAAAAIVLPLAPFAEVDLPWAALILGAGLVRSRGSAAALWALAVALSPAAWLGLPVALRARTRHPLDGGHLVVLLAAGVAVIGLQTALFGAALWTGPRGLLATPLTLDPARAMAVGSGLAAAAWLPVLFAGRRALLLLATAAGALLAPPDVPVWLIAVGPLGVAAGLGVARWPRSRWPILLVLALDLASETRWVYADVLATQADNARIAEVARALGDEEVLVAPWSWGVRVSLARTGDPYGLAWIDPARPPPALAPGACEAPVVGIPWTHAEARARLQALCAGGP